MNKIIPPNSFINGDCMEYLRAMPDNFAGLALVDPPYGIGRDRWDNKPSSEYFDQLFRVSRKQIIWGGNYFNLPTREGWLCWDKTNNGKMFFIHKSPFELAWTSFLEKPAFIRYTLDGNVEGWWNSVRPNYKKEKAIHSCQKPIPIYRKILNQYASAGDLILDTHVGSASSLIACTELGFDYIGFEIDKDYYEAASKRLKQATRKYELFDPK